MVILDGHSGCPKKQNSECRPGFFRQLGHGGLWTPSKPGNLQDLPVLPGVKAYQTYKPGKWGWGRWGGSRGGPTQGVVARWLAVQPNLTLPSIWKLSLLMVSLLAQATYGLHYIDLQQNVSQSTGETLHRALIDIKAKYVYII